MTLYEVRQAIRNETDEARLTALLIERDRLLAEERTEAPAVDFYERMLDATFN